jgi:hypothetical protein
MFGTGRKIGGCGREVELAVGEDFLDPTQGWMVWCNRLIEINA